MDRRQNITEGFIKRALKELRLKPGDRPEFYDKELRGFRARVNGQKPDAKGKPQPHKISFSAVGRIKGVEVRRTIGVWGDPEQDRRLFTVAAARAVADDLLYQMRHGVDSAAEECCSRPRAASI